MIPSSDMTATCSDPTKVFYIKTLHICSLVPIKVKIWTRLFNFLNMDFLQVSTITIRILKLIWSSYKNYLFLLVSEYSELLLESYLYTKGHLYYQHIEWCNMLNFKLIFNYLKERLGGKHFHSNEHLKREVNSWETGHAFFLNKVCRSEITDDVEK